MKNLSSWILSIFIVMFWAFRIIVAINAQTGEDFAGFITFDYKTEVALVFITLISLILIVKRKLIGALLYLCTYGYYFGGYVLKNALPNLIEGNNMEMIVLQNTMTSIIALIIAIFALIDILSEKIKRNKYSDSKTDWFFNNEKTDRNIDERADKNQYKFY